MPLLALVMVLAAALTHATWNYWAKRKERMTPRRVIGAVLIVAGVISLAVTRPT